MKRGLVVLFIVGAAVGSAACSQEVADAENLEVGQTSQAFTENNCTYRSISAPYNGATVSALTTTNQCGLNASSVDGSYQYSNCTNTYLLQVDSSSFQDVKVNVHPQLLPTTEADCINTWVKFRLSGNDATESNYNWGATTAGSAGEVVSVRGVWHPASPPFLPAYCELGPERNVNLLTFAKDGTRNIAVNDFRVIAQVYRTTSFGNLYLPLTINLSRTSAICQGFTGDPPLAEEDVQL